MYFFNYIFKDLLSSSQRPTHTSIGLSLLYRLALVRFLFGTRERDLKLHQAALSIHLYRHYCQTLASHPPHELADFFLILLQKRRFAVDILSDQAVGDKYFSRQYWINRAVIDFP